ncbi:MAG: hypothetical protein HY279_14340 [Nitrospinae bacterium]|nr:hypothetical protein [Nitrospinota bacterium]
MDKDIDKFRNKIPDPPSKIPFVFIGDVNIGEELKKIFGDEKVLTPQNIERIRSYSLSLRDFLTNIKTILLFVKLKGISIDESIEQQYSEEKETMSRTMYKFLLQKDESVLTQQEKMRAIDFYLAIKDSKGQFHLHPLIREIKKGGKR